MPSTHQSEIIFDTHTFVKRLQSVGFTEEQSEVFADEQTKLKFTPPHRSWNFDLHCDWAACWPLLSASSLVLLSPSFAYLSLVRNATTTPNKRFKSTSFYKSIRYKRHAPNPTHLLVFKYVTYGLGIQKSKTPRLQS